MLFAISLLFVSVNSAEAKSSRTASYSMERAWPTAVRCLRIDLGFKIVERDAEAGYVIFELEKDKKTYRGSLELVRTTDHADRDSVRLIVVIRDQPSYEESWILEKMLQRLRDDLGQPVDKEDEPAKKPSPKEEEPKSDDKTSNGNNNADSKNN